MAGFFKRLFGGGDDGEGGDPASRAADETHKGVEIRAAPMKADGGQWRLAGTLTRDGITRQFIRADLVASRDEAVTASISKAKLIIDQNGDHLWKGDTSGPV